jgi:hypothetical protein
MDFITLPNTISKSAGCTINFTPNNSDEECVNVVVIDYNITLSNLEDSAMPDIGASTMQFDTEIGINRMEFTPDDLVKMPINGIANIHLFRMMKEYVYVESKQVEIIKATNVFSASATIIP